MRIVGIDPGAQGAIACIETRGPHVLDARDLVVVDLDRSMAVVDEDWLALLITDWRPEAIAVERQGPIYDPKRKLRFRGSAVAKLMMIAGSIIAVCRLAGTPMHFVTPATWKQALGLTHKPKDYAIHRALALFPESNLFRHGRGSGPKTAAVARAEAALIAWSVWLRALRSTAIEMNNGRPVGAAARM